MMRLLKQNSIMHWDSTYSNAALDKMSDEELDTLHKSFFKVVLAMIIILKDKSKPITNINRLCQYVLEVKGAFILAYQDSGRKYLIPLSNIELITTNKEIL